MKKYYDLEVGQIRKTKAGDEYEIVCIKDCKNVTIRPIGRDYEKVVTAYAVNNGGIGIPKYVVGDTVFDKFGEACKIISKEGNQCVVLWPDGYTRSVQSGVFSANKLVREEDSSICNPTVQLGRVFKNNQGYSMEVVEKMGCGRWLVRFLTPGAHEVVVYGSNLVVGNVHYPFAPTVAGTGILGMKHVDVKSKDYRTWVGMLKRCYSPTGLAVITYAGVTVRKEWHYYENFLEWSQHQVYQDGWAFDKDLLVKGNKVYAPDFCVYLPRELNAFLTDRRNHRGAYPKGVTYRSSVGNFQASCNYKGRSEYLGVYATPEEAFAVYKRRKEAIARELAEEYKGIVDARAIEALKRFTVDITD